MNENFKERSETKGERFKRLATARTQRILNDLRLLGNCSNKISYEYSEADVRKIFLAIEDAVKDTKALFRVKKNGKEFRL